MSVAAGIEIGLGGGPRAGQNQAPARLPGKAASYEWVGAGAGDPMPSSTPGAESFRAGWQSLVASFGAGQSGENEPEAGTSGTQVVRGDFVRDATEGTSKLMPALREAAALPTAKANGQGSGLAAGNTRLSSSGLRAGELAGRTAKTLPLQPAPESWAKYPASARPAGSSEGAPSTDLRKRPESEVVSSGAAAGNVSETPGNALPTIAAPEALHLIKSATEAQPSSIADYRTSQPVSSGGGSFDQTSLTFDGPGVVASSSGAAGGQSTYRVGTQDPGGTPSTPSLASWSAKDQPIEHSEAGDSAASGLFNPAAGISNADSTGEEPPACGGLQIPVGNRHQTSSQDQVQGHTVNQTLAQTPGTAGELARVAVPGGSAGPDGSAAVAEAAAPQSNQPSPVPVAARRTSSEVGARTQGPVPVRFSPAAGTFETAGHGRRVLDGQTGGAVLGVSVSASVRDPGAIHGAIGTEANVGGESSGAAAGNGGSAPRETFTALDGETAPGATTWVHAGGQHAEAGFEDPTLGWIGVRAEMSGGAVHASLVPGSMDAGQTLSGHLTGLNAYLAEHHALVEPVTLAAPQGSSDSGMNQGTGQSMHQGSGQQMGQEPGQGDRAGSQSSTHTETHGFARTVPQRIQVHAGVPDTTTPITRPGSVHISVMA